MAVIHDVMPAFELVQPTSVDGALAVLARHGTAAWVLAGGMDTFDWLKDRTKRPAVVVDLSGIEALRGIRSYAGGLEIGAMTPLSEVVAHPTVRQQYGLLMEAADWWRRRRSGTKGRSGGT
jgi:xanthine dehydrogenase YagS FAD-binding subunit